MRDLGFLSGMRVTTKMINQCLLRVFVSTGLLCVGGQVLAEGGEETVTPPAPKAVQSPGGVGDSWSAQVAGDKKGAAKLSEADAATVAKVSDYFNSLKTLQGRFEQTGADNKVMKGKFKMQRPGKFRFDYARPSLQVVISDGRYLAIQDHDLGNEDRVALDQTPFRVLLRKDVNLLKDADIFEVQQTGDIILIGIKDKSPDTPGKIKLMFNTAPEMVLQEWITTDAQGLDTRVKVGNLKLNEDLDAKQFVIKAPEKRILR